MKLHESAENYLETIYILKNRFGYVRGVDIARELNFSKPSASRAIANLREEVIVTLDPNGMILLTDEGHKIAESVFARHTFLKNFLISIGVEEQEANDEACKIEHDISLDTFEKMKKAFPDIEC